MTPVQDEAARRRRVRARRRRTAAFSPGGERLISVPYEIGDFEETADPEPTEGA